MNWTDQHAGNLSALLKSTPLIEALEARRPKVISKRAEEVFGEAKEQAGFELCIEELRQLASKTTQQPQTPPYIAGLDTFEQPAPPQPT